ncbi:MAG: 16S rRNA (guanine(966)-N(2))-methyltransferase RsmD [bacterium]|nr:16S rRNA (guanine(966)-N(2))-methyltransferase RsmD [bacterium]
MRITGGEVGGRRIKVPRGIRPTQDKVRTAIFNILGDRIKDVKFVDLFAGSGSVGIEAISRGASEVIFVEKSRKVVSVLNENLKSLGYMEKSKVINGDALKVKLKTPDIIFADPPYDMGFAKKVIDLWLISKRLLILEHSKHEKVDLGTHYTFGDTVITLIVGG